VRFGEVMRQLVAEGSRRFLELGPHGVLLDAMQEGLAGRPGTVIGSLPAQRAGTLDATARPR